MKTCTVEDCGRQHYARGYCERHYARLRRNGDLDLHHQRGEQHYKWQQEPNYLTAHLRIYQERGPAKNQTCEACGDPGEEWALVYGSPCELTDEKGRKYSPCPGDYQSLCRACHRLGDRRYVAA